MYISIWRCRVKERLLLIFTFSVFLIWVVGIGQDERPASHPMTKSSLLLFLYDTACECEKLKEPVFYHCAGCCFDAAFIRIRTLQHYIIPLIQMNMFFEKE